MRDIVRELNEVVDLAEVVLDVGGDFPGLTPSSTGAIKGRHGALEGGGDACRLDLDKNRWVCFKRKQEGCQVYHGGPVEWVLSHKFNDDPRQFRDAVAYLCNLYAIDFTDDPVNTRQHQVYELLTYVSDCWHEALLADADMLEFVKTQYGLNDETISALKIGFANELPEDVITDKNLLLDAGLIALDWAQPLTGRITVPHYIFNQVVWMAGRVPRAGAATAKYSCLYKTSFVKPRIYGFDTARSWKDKLAPLFITEGLFDAAKAINDGARTVAIAGVEMFTPEMQQDIRHLVDGLQNCVKYLVFDSEISGRGYAGALSVGQKLLKLGADPLILQLPRPEGVKKVDLCDFLKANGVKALADLSLEATRETRQNHPMWRPTVGYLMAETITPYSENSAVQRIIEVISCMTEIEASPYIDYLATKKGTKAAILKKAVADARKKREKTTEYRALDEYPIALKFGQDIRYDDIAKSWVQHRVVWQPVEIKETYGTEESVRTVLRPVLLTVRYPDGGGWVLEDKQVLDVDKMTVEDRSNIPPSSECIVESNQWSMRKQNPYSYVNFVEGNSTISPPIWGLFQELKALLADFVWLHNPMDYELITAYVFMSYVYSGFSAIPYLQFKGEPGSGKSQINYFVNEFGYNSIMTLNLNAAPLYRLAHALRGIMIIDEAERLAHPTSDDLLALLSVCNGGYQGAAGGRGSPVLRCDSADVSQIRRYDTYCPKVFISTRSLPDTLLSRSIMVHAMKVPKDQQEKYMRMKGFDVWASTNRTAAQQLRDQLHVWGLTKVSEVMRHHDLIDENPALTLHGRDRQIWRPLLAIMSHIYECGKQDFSSFLSYVVEKQQSMSRIRQTGSFQSLLSQALVRVIEQERDPRVVVVLEGKGEYLNIPALTQVVLEEFLADKLYSADIKVDARIITNRLIEMGGCISRSVYRPKGASGQRIRLNAFYRDQFTGYMEANPTLLAEEDEKVPNAND